MHRCLSGSRAARSLYLGLPTRPREINRLRHVRIPPPAHHEIPGMSRFHLLDGDAKILEQDNVAVYITKVIVFGDLLSQSKRKLSRLVPYSFRST